MPESDCPTPDELAAYHTGTLPEEAAQAVTDHLAGCAACQASLERLAAAGDRLAALLRDQGPADSCLDEPPCQEALAGAKAEAGRWADSPSHDQPRSPSQPLGQLGEYRLQCRRGGGGMGTVYRAVHARLGRTVAVKLLDKQWAGDPEAILRFQHEMQAVGRLDHPHIVRATDAGEAEGTLFLVMEYVDGLDLSELLRRVGPLRIANACELIRQAALGLEHAHQQGLVHRDIKPSNLMLAGPTPPSGHPDGQFEVRPDRPPVVKILDFGLARLRSPPEGTEEATVTGQAVGTADYIAPEQVADSRAVDTRADIYSLGCTLYKLLSGYAPFSGRKYSSNFAKMMGHLEDRVPPIRGARPDVPRALAAVLDRMLAKDPGDRYARPAEVAEAMAPFARGADLAQLLARTRGVSASGAVASRSTASTAVFPTPGQRDTSPGDATTSRPAAAVRSGPPGRWAAGDVAVGLLLLAPVAALACLVLLLLPGRGGHQEVVVRTPEGGEARLGPNGRVEVAMEGPHAASRLARVSQPPPVAGAESWTIETRGHRGEVQTVAYSPDGQLLATGCEDGTIRIWDARTGELTAALVGHDAAVQSIGWSPDGTSLVSGGRDNTVRLWNVQSGKLLRTLPGTAESVRSMAVAWSPDSRRVAAASPGNTIRVWDAASGNQLWAAHQKAEGARCLAWSPDAKTLAAGSDDRTIRLWDGGSGTLQKTFSGEPGPVTGVAWSPDGTRIASSCLPVGRKDSVRVRDARTGAVQRTFAGHRYGTATVAFSPDGKTLAAGGTTQDPTVQVWNAETGQLICNRHLGRGVPALAFSPDGKDLAVACLDGTVRVQEAATGQPRTVLPQADPSVRISADGRWEGAPGTETDVFYVVVGSSGQQILDPAQFAARAGGSLEQRVRGYLRKTLRGHTAGVPSVAFSPNGRTLASASRDGTIRLWDAATGERRLTLRGHTRSVWAVAFSPDGRTLASASSDRTVRLWDVATGQQQKVLRGHTSYVRCAAFSPDGKTLASGGSDGTVVFWDAATGLRRRTIGWWEIVGSLAFSPDGTTLAVGDFEWVITLWDVETGQKQKTLHGHQGDVFSVAFSPDGKTLASSSRDATIRLWDAGTGQLLRELPGRSEEFAALAFSPDGKMLAAASRGSELRLWDVATGQVWATLVGHTERVISLAFSPDGRTLASGSYDDTVRLWDLRRETRPPGVAVRSRRSPAAVAPTRRSPWDLDQPARVTAVLFGGPDPAGAGDRIADLCGLEDGSLVACGVIHSLDAVPRDVPVVHLITGEPDNGPDMGFVARFSADLEQTLWFACFPPSCFEPRRVAADADGSIVVGGRRLARFFEAMPELEGTAKPAWDTDVVLLKLARDGSRLLWARPGGPKQTQLTGLAVDRAGRACWTAAASDWQMATYLMRVQADGSDMDSWSDRPEARQGWVELHHSADDLSQLGQFWGFYKRGNRGGVDYDGPGGLGKVQLALRGLNPCAGLALMPDDGVVVCGAGVYEYWVDKSHGAPWDVFLARYGPEGLLKWSTNLYQPGDSIHRMHQQARDVHYDPATSKILVLATQHGSGTYRLMGEIHGNPGGAQLSWVGRVHPGSGKLEAGWYFHTPSPGSDPGYPKLATNSLCRLATDADGRTYLTGTSVAMPPTTPTAYQHWPAGQNSGRHAVLVVLDPELKKPLYATVLRGNQLDPRGTAIGHFEPTSLAVTRHGVYVAGSTDAAGFPAGPQPPWANREVSGRQDCAVVRLGFPARSAGGPPADAAPGPTPAPDGTGQAALPDAAPPARAVAPFDPGEAQRLQKQWADYLGVPVQKTGPLGMELVLIPPGTFSMGSSDGKPPAPAEATLEAQATGSADSFLAGVGQPHQVEITRPFYLGQYEVTVGQFRAFVEATGYRTEAETSPGGCWGFDRGRGKFVTNGTYSWRQPGFPQTAQHPVGHLSWNDAQAFCQWLSQQEGEMWRLPTEAEWEYACRAGTITAWYSGDDEAALAQVANLSDQSLARLYPQAGPVKWAAPWIDGYPFTAPVGQFRPNAFGLFDMHGNETEWCGDWYLPGYSAASPQKDPSGPPGGFAPVHRGAGYHYAPFRCRSDYRSSSPPTYPQGGFRVVCQPSGWSARVGSG